MEYYNLGDGDEKTLGEIIMILNEKILKNETILKPLLELTLSKAEIINRINTVSKTGLEISNTIQNQTFKKAKCCPTFWNLVKNIFCNNLFHTFATCSLSFGASSSCQSHLILHHNSMSKLKLKLSS